MGSFFCYVYSSGDGWSRNELGETLEEKSATPIPPSSDDVILMVKVKLESPRTCAKIRSFLGRPATRGHCAEEASLELPT